MLQFAFFDLETDPFSFPGQHDKKQTDNLDIMPFCVGCSYYEDTRPYFSAWGDDCIKAFVREMDENTTPTIYYAHNGGKFDMKWLLPYLPPQQLVTISGRLVLAEYGIHQIRDSFSLFALPLAKLGGKLEIDYALMRRSVRNKHKAEILRYLRADCEVLRGAVMTLIKTESKKTDTFTDVKWTAASYAWNALLREMKAASKSETLDSDGNVYHPIDLFVPKKIAPEKREWILARKRKHDEFYRRYYFGGITRVFKAGVFEGVFNLYDAHSMYPSAMKLFKHPVSDKNDSFIQINPKKVEFTADGDIVGYEGWVYAIEFIGETIGVLTQRRDGVNSLDYRRDRNYMISHEFKVCRELGTLKIERIIGVRVFNPKYCSDFAPFVDKYYAKRNEAAAEAKKHKEGSAEYDEANAFQNVFKTMLNSAYGKAAQESSKFDNKYWVPSGHAETEAKPEGFSEYARANAWRVDDELPNEDEGTITTTIGKIYPEKQPPEAENYYNVLMSASITSAARGLLMRKIHQAVSNGGTIYYCDTDSALIGGEVKGAADIFKNNKVLGEWGVDQSGIYKIAIAGPKLYALWYEKDGARKVKQRSKGARLSADEIERLAKDPDYMARYYSEAPTVSVFEPMKELERFVKATAKPVPYGSIDDYRRAGISPRNDLLDSRGDRVDPKVLRDKAIAAERKAEAERKKRVGTTTAEEKAARKTTKPKRKAVAR